MARNCKHRNVEKTLIFFAGSGCKEASMEVIPACVWEEESGSGSGSGSGSVVTEERASWEMEFPTGPCKRVSQVRNCTCGASASCEEFLPHAFRMCTSGCGSHAHGTVLWSEERVRFVGGMSYECEPQIQGRGSRCVGAYGGTEKGALLPKTEWCVKDGAYCSTTRSLFLSRTCSIVELPRPSAPPMSPPIATIVDGVRLSGNMPLLFLMGCVVFAMSILASICACLCKRTKFLTRGG